MLIKEDAFKKSEIFLIIMVTSFRWDVDEFEQGIDKIINGELETIIIVQFFC